MTNPARYGCFDRPPYPPAYTNGPYWIPTFGQPDCQFTLSELGRRDPGCAGCKHQSTKGA